MGKGREGKAEDQLFKIEELDLNPALLPPQTWGAISPFTLCLWQGEYSFLKNYPDDDKYIEKPEKYAIPLSREPILSETFN